MIGCGIATTSALIMRVPGGHGTICGGAAVEDAALGAGGVSFAASVSGVAGGAVVSSFVVALAVFESASALSTEAVAVWAAIIDAVNKITVITANEMTSCLGADLKPSISLLLFVLLKWRH